MSPNKSLQATLATQKQAQGPQRHGGSVQRGLSAVRVVQAVKIHLLSVMTIQKSAV